MLYILTTKIYLGAVDIDNLKILIIEDDEDISKFIQMELEYEGYITDVVFDGREAIKKLETNNYDLALLDIMLPNLNGLDVLRRVRKWLNTPIIMLTAKDEITDKVMGLDMGANDYITKPFVIEELLARIRAVLRERMSSSIDSRLTFDNLIMDTERRTVKVNTKSISLTKNEFFVLEMLLKNKNQVVKREDIIKVIWGDNYVGDSNALDVYISHIRTKIDKDKETKMIQTVRGVGYTINEEIIGT